MAQVVAIELDPAAARRPEDATRVRLEGFEGPLGLLLALIEQRRLDVLSVRLGDLAGAYLDAVARIEDGRLAMLSSFVAVCAQLILIKSRALLPRPPASGADRLSDTEGDPEEVLRQRLIEYRRYRDAGQLFSARLGLHVALFHREAGVASAAGRAGARPADQEPVPATLLADALLESLRLVPPAPPPAEAIARTITLEERARAIRDALRDAPALVLQELLAGVTDRIVVAVTFLALLELVKGREVVIEQAEPWGPIHVRRSNTPPVPSNA
jgi:segregation and condensation protein A